MFTTRTTCVYSCIAMMLVLCTNLLTVSACYGLSVAEVEVRSGMHEWQRAAKSYRKTHGAYPRTDESSTWYEKLIESGFVRQGDFFETSDGSLPVDVHGFPYIYEIPAAPGEPVVLRSVGANGIDDSGTLDDWDIRFGPNWGYWYKRDWPAILRHILLLLTGILAGAIVMVVLIKPRLVGIAVALLTGGIVFACFGPVLPSRWAYDHPFTWVGWIAPVSISIGALILTVEAVRRLIRRYRRPLDLTLCQACQYDLRGTLAAGREECPECGARIYRSVRICKGD